MLTVSTNVPRHLVRCTLDNVSPARYVWDAGGNGLTYVQ